MKLDWKPQDAYAEFFLNSASDILRYRSVFRPDIDYFVPYGGRGGGKTWTFADALAVEASIRPVRVLVTREVQGSIAESIKSEIENAMEARGLGSFFDYRVQDTVGANGSKFIYKGLRDQSIANIKSIADVDIVICEESEATTKKSWSKLLPSIRPRDQITRGGSPIIIVIFNTDQEYDDTYQRFVVNPPPKTISKLINYCDNIHFPPHLEVQRAHAEKTMPPAEYANIWMGEPLGSSDKAIIQQEWVKAARFASRHPEFVKAGVKSVGYDPSGEGKDSNAVVCEDGNMLIDIDEWPKSKDLREASGRAFGMAIKNKADRFSYDACGGLGDGVSVFVGDLRDKHKDLAIEVLAFDAGAAVVNKDDSVLAVGDEGGKTWGDTYSNAKAQAWGVKAQKLYNTYRFIELGDRDMSPHEMCSIDIDNDDMFIKLLVELTSPIWIKSRVNSKRLVEAKSDTEKRTGQKSPNLADAYIMTTAPQEVIEPRIPIAF